MARATTYGYAPRQRVYTKEDFVKTRFMFRILFLVAFMAILSLVYIWSRVKVVEYGYEINSLKNREYQLTEANKKLQIEIASLAQPEKIVAVATQKLQMSPPQGNEIQAIQMVKSDTLVAANQP